jgi:putative pyoverdin transport system ATP-binding/permease protein
VNFVRLLTRLGPAPLYRLIAGAIASAASSTLVLAIVNIAAGDIAKAGKAEINWLYAAIFVVCVVIYTAMESWMVAWMSADMEEAVNRIRMDLLERLSRADLWKLEQFGQTRLYDSITQTGQLITGNAHFLALSLRSLVLTLAILVYIAWISLLAFAIVAVLLIVCTFRHTWLGRETSMRQAELAGDMAQLQEGFSDLFDGFKEQRLNSARSKDLGDTFRTVSNRAMETQNVVHRYGWQQFSFGSNLFNIMLGAVVFVVPVYAPAFNQQVVHVAAAVLFMSAPFAALMQTVTLMGAADAAAGRMLTLDRELGELEEAGSDVLPQPVSEDFTELSLKGMEFAFPAPEGEQAFAVGPLDFTVHRGEIVFVTGGNGSGKSTFLRLLTGLYHPPRGALLYNGQRIEPEHYAAFRARMATVFSDFHLFARLYDLGPDADTLAAELMRMMEMTEITSFDGDRFARRDLSTGQRRRLGLIGALLEEKPLLILDEWAADQDPQFRRKFYREILPALKARGLTIVAVTHDDRYFDAADRRIRMEEGRIVSDTSAEAACA